MSQDRYALLIGINNYHKSYDQLQAPENEAKKLGEILEKYGDFQVDVVEEKNFLSLKGKISDFYSNKKKDDILLFYFNGHGEIDLDDEFFFIVEDTEKNHPDVKGISGSYLLKKMEKSSKKQIVILDCCHSEALVPKGETMATHISNELKGAKGCFILTSCRHWQHSYEIKEKNEYRSFFSKALIEGIESGNADKLKNGIITIKELSEYVQYNIQSERQNPVIIERSEGDIELIRNPTSKLKDIPLGSGNLETEREKCEYYLTAGKNLVVLKQFSESLEILEFAKSICNKYLFKDLIGEIDKSILEAKKGIEDQARDLSFTRYKKAAIFGSWRYIGDDNYPRIGTKKDFETVCIKLGEFLAEKKIAPIVSAYHSLLADFYIIKGYINKIKEKLGRNELIDEELRIQFYTTTPADKLNEYVDTRFMIITTIMTPDFKVAQLRAIKESHIVIVIGGSENSYEAGMEAFKSKKILVPIDQFGGAGKKLCDELGSDILTREYSDSLFREIQDFKNSITRKLNNSKSKDLTGIKKPDGPNDKVIFKDTQIPRFEAAVLEELEIRLNIKLPLVYKIENSTQLGFVVESEKVLGLNLYHCNISYLPESISNLTSLQTLNLSRNKLTVVPESITNLTSLKILYLSSNPLTSLPNSIGNLISLEKLYLDNNLLTSLPESFSNLISLQTLILSRNKLTEITEKIGVLKALKLLDLSHNNIQRIENLEHLHNLEYFNIQYNNLSDDEKIIARKSIQEIRDYCDKKKNNPMPKNELRRKKARIYEIEIKKLLYEGLNEVKKEMEIEFLHLGTWRESTNGPHRHLLENQSSWFRENQDKSLILNNKINDANVIKVFMVQLHELPLVFSFGPSETNVGKFVRFLNTIYENTSGSVLQYGSTKMEVKKKINTILNLILHDSSTKKIIVFPESSLPLDYIDEVRIQLQAHLKSHEKDTIIFIGGIEHAPSKQMHQLFNYENRAVIIDNCIGPYFQVKQTPTIISNQDHNLIRECINLQPFPKINLYDTSLGRIAIFFPSDFLRLKEAIPQWSLDYKVDFIVIPSLLGNVMAFYNNVFNIYNHRLPQLKILYANVGEFGGSELFSVYTNSEIKYIFQKKQRDNIGEVIVTRECKLN